MEAKKFIDAVCSYNTDEVVNLLKKNPNILSKICFMSIGYEGGRGMEVWKYLCNMINDEKTNIKLRDLSYKIAEHLEDKEQQMTLFYLFGYRGHWIEHIKKALELGFTLTEEDMVYIETIPNEEIMHYIF